MSRIEEKLKSLRVGKSIKCGDASITKSQSGYIYHSPRIGQLTLNLEQAIAFASDPIGEEDKIVKGTSVEVKVVDEGMEEMSDQLDLKFKEDGSPGIKQGELFTKPLGGGINKGPKSDISRYKRPK